ncbi:DNA polymerase III subunit epsilon [Arthrobacter crystallopoietes BAB-32]|uniref:DNA polymerase III subunit epsilon n=1 Tax=Arthrobacter crystallopoietes BAB-32 TaxID=1246476 RepID=N1V6H1_9MICC|nr:3'-5' exonuclease [Arthrobacter crystallopoietes]EMY35619.1 DNA polymerase III subunit epsilon [Arthrobacter crystallopoietes BAB-32]
MISWHELPRAAFDLETTGRDPLEARIVTASIILVDGAGQPLQQHEWLVDPGIEIPLEASAIHGVTTEQARFGGQRSVDAVAEISSVLGGFFAAGVPVIAFNASYDFTVLKSECDRHGLPGCPARPVIDPFVLDKQVDRYRRGKRTLTALSFLYGVRLDAAHTSAADALAAIGVADALAAKYSELRMDPKELHDAQIGWCARQAAGLQQWLRRTNPDASVDGRWPLIEAGEPVPVIAAGR